MEKPETKQEFAKKKISEWINSGTYPPGSKLPTIVDMAKKMHFTPQPVRRAIAILVKQGVLRTTNGVGVFVCQPGKKERKIMILANSQEKTIIRGTYHPSSFLSWKIYDGIRERIDKAGYEPLLCFINEYAGRLDRLVEQFRNEKCLGIIGLPSIPPELLYPIGNLVGLHRIISTDYSNFPTHWNEIRVNYKTGINQVLEKAFAYGHRKIAFFYGKNLDVGWSHLERYRLFITFCREKSLTINPLAFIETGGSAIDGYRATLQVLKQVQDVTLIFAVTDERTKGVLRALADKGVTPGKEISVIGFDDIPESRELNLTTVRVPRTEIGMKSIDLLEKTVSQKSINRKMYLETEGVFRSSLGPAPG